MSKKKSRTKNNKKSVVKNDIQLNEKLNQQSQELGYIL